MTRARELMTLLCLALLGMGAGLGCQARVQNEAAPVMRMITVVVTSTSGPTQTPHVITELQTVVVTATPEPTMTATQTPTATHTRRATTVPTEPVMPEMTATPLRSPSPTQARPPTTIPTARPTQPPPPAITQVGQQFKYPAPRLVAPASDTGFSDQPPVLEWEGAALAEDEYFEVTIERLWQERPYYAGSDWTKEPLWAVPRFVRGTSDTNHYTWWVTIKRLTGTNAAGGRVGEALSPPSEQRTFTWSP